MTHRLYSHETESWFISPSLYFLSLMAPANVIISQGFVLVSLIFFFCARPKFFGINFYFDFSTIRCIQRLAGMFNLSTSQRIRLYARRLHRVKREAFWRICFSWFLSSLCLHRRLSMPCWIEIRFSTEKSKVEHVWLWGNYFPFGSWEMRLIGAVETL